VLRLRLFVGRPLLQESAVGFPSDSFRHYFFLDIASNCYPSKFPEYPLRSLSYFPSTLQSETSWNAFITKLLYAYSNSAIFLSLPSNPVVNSAFLSKSC